MKEIGGYFGLEKLISNEYYDNLISLNNGRSSLIYILKAKKIQKIYIPYYLCDSVKEILIRNNYEFEKYNIDSEFMPIFNKKLKDKEYLYIVNYYGQLSDEIITKLKEKYQNIIIDNTHAFFQRPIKGIDTIYTCRKFFGVPDGAYISTDYKLNEKLSIDISKDRMKHLLGRFEGKASEYYYDFKSNDKLFKNEPLKYMSNLTHNILGAIDYKTILQIRNENYQYLHNKLCKYNKLNINMPYGAFSYPFYTENGRRIREELLKKNIYVSTLWPNVLEEMPENSLEFKYSANILPLPCDQRYSIEDMQYIVDILLNYIHKDLFID